MTASPIKPISQLFSSTPILLETFGRCRLLGKYRTDVAAV
jgi:hypothetical protein